MALAELAELQALIEHPMRVPEVMADAATTPPDPAPSGAEVLAADKTYYDNLKLQQTPNVVEDHRRPAPPREVAERPYTQYESPLRPASGR
jgi:hypothetical protein